MRGPRTWILTGSFVAELEHARRWPREHWRLAFRGQLRAVFDADAELIVDRMRAAAASAAQA